MCLGQVGNLLPHVVVPAIMAQHLMPLWGSQRRAGWADGERLCVRIHAGGSGLDDAHRSHRCAQNSGARIDRQRPCDHGFGLLADGLLSASLALGSRRHRLCRRLHAGLEGAHRPAPAGRYVAQRDALHVELFGRRRPLVPGLAAGRRPSRVARRLHRHGARRRSSWSPSAYCSHRSKPKPKSGPLLDFRPVFRNRPALGYILGYGSHCFELYGMRTWIVAFWTFVAARNPDDVAAQSDRGERHRHAALLPGQHLGQRGGAAVRATSRDHRRDDRLRRHRAVDRRLNGGAVAARCSPLFSSTASPCRPIPAP